MASKINKTRRLSRKLQKLLPRSSLTTKYRTFVKTHLEYVDVYLTKSTMHLSTKILYCLDTVLAWL